STRVPQPPAGKSSRAADSFRAIPNLVWIGIGVALIAAAVLIVVLSSSSSSSGSDLEFTGTGYPGVDTANTRFVKGPIESGNASGLKVAWKLPLSAQST